VGLRYVFLPNGRYQGAGGTQQYGRTMTTTTAYFGDGTYSIGGNTIVLSADDGRLSMKYFRIQKSSRDSGRTWSDELCMLDPGAMGEVCYRKELAGTIR
jgi:hypothetical protein